MFRSIVAVAMLATASFAVASASHAGYDAPAWSTDDPSMLAYNDGTTTGAYAEAEVEGQARLMIVDRNKGRVIYDDGRNDLFCVTGVYIAGYTWNGYPVYRRNMRCR